MGARIKSAVCKLTHHKINRYRAMRTPNLVSMGCQRCGRQVNLVTDQWAPGSGWLASFLWVFVPAAGMTLIAVLAGWTK